MKNLQAFLDGDHVHIPAVVCFLIQGNKVLLGRRIKVSGGLGHNLLAGIGGKVGDEEAFANETHEEALIREVAEEIGVVIKTWQEVGRVRFFHRLDPRWDQDVKIYTVTKWNREPTKTVAMEPVWVSIDALPTDQMWEDNRHWLPKILANQTVNGAFLYGENGKVEEYKFL